MSQCFKHLKLQNMALPGIQLCNAPQQFEPGCQRQPNAAGVAGAAAQHEFVLRQPHRG